MTLVQAGSTMAASTRCFRRCLPHLLLLLHLLICCGSPVHGHSAQPPPPPRLLTQSLSGSSWQLTSSNGSIHAPATVPGSAYLDLLHSHVIPEPYYRFNEQSTRWVALTDWHYSTTFIPLPSLLSLPHVELVFDGIDTIATVLLDDRPILRTNDMFRRWVVDVTEQLRGGGQHRLEVRLQSAVAYAAQLNASYPYPLPRADAPAQHPLGERQFVRKSQVDWGWNNQPAFGTVGIYRDVHLVAFRNAIIRDVVASQTHANALTHADAIAQGLRAGDVQLNVTAYLRVAPRSPSSVFFHACVAGLCVNSSSVDLTAPLDQSGDALVPISAILVVPSPALWWPQTLGNATLHPFHLTLFSSPTQAEHSLTRRIGFRYLSIRRSPTPPTPGLTFQVEVNGVAMFVRGTNVVPLDSFHARVTPEWRERLVESLRVSRLNVARVSGRMQTLHSLHACTRLSRCSLTSVLVACVCVCRSQVGRRYCAAGRLVRSAGRGGDHRVAGVPLRMRHVPHMALVAGRSARGDSTDRTPPLHARVRPPLGR